MAIDSSKLPSSVRKPVLECLGVEIPEKTIVLRIPAETIAEMNALTPMEVARLYAEYHLGYKEWADLIIGAYEAAKLAEVPTTK